MLDIERQRKAERIKLARANDVWEYRTSPPPEWSAPLPDYSEIERQRNRNAEQKLKELVEQKKIETAEVNKRQEEELKKMINK